MSAESWEPLIEDGREAGQVHWLIQADGGRMAGLWRIRTEGSDEIPYRVTGSDTFHVIEGETELETPGGENRAHSWGASTPSRMGSPRRGGPDRHFS